MHVPALRSLPLCERSSRAACRPWARSLGGRDSGVPRALRIARVVRSGKRLLADCRVGEAQRLHIVSPLAAASRDGAVPRRSRWRPGTGDLPAIAWL